MFSFNILSFMVGFFISDSILQLRNLFGPVGIHITLINYYILSTLLNVPLGFAENILFQCFMVFFWKKLAMINDDFLATFFFLFNLMISQIISLIRLMNGDFYKRDAFGILSGIDIETEKEFFKKLR